MAKSAEKSAAEPVLKDKAPVETGAVHTSPAKKEPAPMYSIDDLVKAEKALDADKIIIRTALRLTERKMFGLDEAKQIVKEFKERKVIPNGNDV